jgi:hypothetical protein
MSSSTGSISPPPDPYAFPTRKPSQVRRHADVDTMTSSRWRSNSSTPATTTATTTTTTTAPGAPAKTSQTQTVLIPVGLSVHAEKTHVWFAVSLFVVFHTICCGLLFGVSYILPFLGMDNFDLTHDQLFSFLVSFSIAVMMTSTDVLSVLHVIGSPTGVCMIMWLISVPIYFVIGATSDWGWVVLSNALLGTVVVLVWMSTLYVLLDLLPVSAAALRRGMTKHHILFDIGICAAVLWTGAHAAEHHEFDSVAMYGALASMFGCIGAAVTLAATAILEPPRRNFSSAVRAMGTSNDGSRSNGWNMLMWEPRISSAGRHHQMHTVQSDDNGDDGGDAKHRTGDQMEDEYDYSEMDDGMLDAGFADLISAEEHATLLGDDDDDHDAHDDDPDDDYDGGDNHNGDYNGDSGSHHDIHNSSSSAVGRLKHQDVVTHPLELPLLSRWWIRRARTSYAQTPGGMFYAQLSLVSGWRYDAARTHATAETVSGRHESWPFILQWCYTQWLFWAHQLTYIFRLRRGFGVFALGSFAYGLAQAVIWGLLPLFLNAFDISLLHVTWIVALHYMSRCASQLLRLPHRMAARIGCTWTTTLGFWISGFSLLYTAWCPALFVVTTDFAPSKSVLVFSTASVSCGFGMSLLQPGLRMHATERAPFHHMGRIIVMSFFWEGAGMFAAAITCGRATDRYGAPVAFSMVAVVLCICGVWNLMTMDLAKTRFRQFSIGTDGNSNYSNPGGAHGQTDRHHSTSSEQISHYKHSTLPAHMHGSRHRDSNLFDLTHAMVKDDFARVPKPFSQSSEFVM